MNLILMGPPGQEKVPKRQRLSRNIISLISSTGDIFRENIKNGTEYRQEGTGIYECRQAGSR